MSEPRSENAPLPVVWFDGNSVVDGVVAVFGPMTERLHEGQAVLANMEDESLYEATVVLVHPMYDRDLASVRLGPQIGSSGGPDE